MKLSPPALFLALVPLTLGPGRPQQAEGAQSFLCPPCGAECHFKTYPKAGNCGVCGMGLVALASVPQAGVLLFPDVDLLSSTLVLGVLAGSNSARVFTVADTDDPVRANDALEMKPQFGFAECPPLDVLVVPDGFGAWEDALIVEWVKKTAERARLVVAVGFGSVVLARAGLFEGSPDARLPATQFLVERGKELVPTLVLDPDARWTRQGKFLLARDAFGALDATLAAVEELGGEARARRTAERLGIPWTGEKKQ